MPGTIIIKSLYVFSNCSLTRILWCGFFFIINSNSWMTNINTIWIPDFFIDILFRIRSLEKRNWGPNLTLHWLKVAAIFNKLLNLCKYQFFHLQNSQTFEGKKYKQEWKLLGTCRSKKHHLIWSSLLSSSSLDIGERIVHILRNIIDT